MATKVLLCYNDDRNPAYHKVIRMTLPNEWLTLPTKMLLKYYVKAYNSVYAKKLKVSEVHLAKYVGGENDPRKSYDGKLYEPIPSEELISVHIMDRAQVYVRRGKGVEYSSVYDRPTSYDSALRMIEEASSYVSDTPYQPTDSFDIDHDEDDASGPKTSIVELRAVLEEEEENNNKIDDIDNEEEEDGRNDTASVSTAGGWIQTKSSHVSNNKDARQDLSTIEAVRSMTSVASTARRSVVSTSSKKPYDDIDVVTKNRSFTSIGSRKSTTKPFTSKNEYYGKPIKSFESLRSEKSKSVRSSSASARQAIRDAPLSPAPSKQEETIKTSKSNIGDLGSIGSGTTKDSKLTGKIVTTTTATTATPPPVTEAATATTTTPVDLNVHTVPHSLSTISAVTMKEEAEDAALIRFRSILDWLGVQPALYDGVVRSLQQELAVLPTDEEKHELVKKKLGALLEASYLNSNTNRPGTTSAVKTVSSSSATADEKYQSTTVDKKSTVGSITSAGSRVSGAANSNAELRSATVSVE